ncbi:exosporium protein C [Cytobacillus depressus]|uniref:Exosporium protein C n=1 Tax=Cytobacillus depressus TaxID=1602942 RepID=A0A6L3V2S4_9BACI|nr:exosporium protein C [Cytobacillus depressus]KAB2330761.1 exosporium protein C [Cytobacillus depressus]
MVQVLDYQATEPLSMFNPAKGFIIPQAPFRVILASIRLNIPANASRNNKVELVSTVGVEGITNISQVVFRIFRNGREIFNTQTGVESAGSEINYNFTFQAIDFNVNAGANFYQLTVENITPNTQANVVGPISFSGLAIKNTK